MPSQNLQQSIRISIIVLVAFLLRRSFDLRRRQHVAFESRLLQLVAKNETVSRGLVDDHYFCVASCLPPLFQIFDHLSRPARVAAKLFLSAGSRFSAILFTSV